MLFKSKNFLIDASSAKKLESLEIIKFVIKLLSSYCINFLFASISFDFSLEIDSV